MVWKVQMALTPNEERGFKTSKPDGAVKLVKRVKSKTGTDLSSPA